ncbi:MAG TPA: L,D-transpeptidase family protein [archaeon]|nr:L,D-transpeptidase family protein [archaeon]
MKVLLYLLSVLMIGPRLLTAQELPFYLMEMGEGHSNYAFVVDKKNQVLSLFQGSPEGPQLFKKYRCTTGKNNNGSKYRAGDNKTPNGIYFFRGILEDEQLPEKYGVRAFPMDYPNDYDRLSNKTGSGIWLHAVDDDNRVEISYDTEGCVVVTNNDMVDLTPYVSLYTTPIIIDDSIFTVSKDQFQAEKKKILDLVSGWVDAWQNKELDRYMNYYDERFQGSGRNRSQHRAHKQTLNRNYKEIKVDISDIRIYHYHKYIVLSFNQEYRSNLFNSKGRKRLYLANTGDEWKIISERFQRM